MPCTNSIAEKISLANKFDFEDGILKADKFGICFKDYDTVVLLTVTGYRILACQVGHIQNLVQAH